MKPVNDNTYIAGKKHVDGKRLRADGTPWTSTSEVLLTVALGDRVESQEFYIVDKLWWLKGGVADVNLIEKLEGGTGELISKFTSNPTYTIDEAVIYIPANQTWLINSVPYTNPIINEIPFNYAGVGASYFLTIVATKFNTFIARVGGQSLSNPDEPIIDLDEELPLTTFLVYDNEVTVVIPPVNSNIFVEKEIYQPQIIYGTTPYGAVGMGKKSALVISGTIPSVEFISKNNPNDYFIGTPFYTINKTPNTVKFPHLSSTIAGNPDSIAWFNPELKDYTSQPGELTLWNLDIVDGQKVYRRASSSLQNESVTLEKLAQMPAKTFIGNAGNAEAIPQHIDKLDALEMLGLENASSKIAAIEAILASDNINLDTLQEIVDAIKDIDTYLSTILVNDLTTGGTTKALTAEMGKTLKTSLDALTLVVNGKQATLTDTNFAAFVNSTTTKDAIVDADKLGYFNSVNSKWVNTTWLKVVDYFKGYFQTKTQLITTATTATKGSKYIATGTFTITDFVSPVQGDNYEVTVRNGTITVDGIAYKTGTIIKRIYDATWKSYVYRQQLPIKISTGVTGTYDIDPTVSDEFSLTLTGNTQLNFPNFSTVFSDVLSGNVSGNFGVTYEAGTKVAGSYIGSATLNVFAVKKTNGVVTLSWTNYL